MSDTEPEQEETTENVNTLWSKLDNLFRASLTDFNASKQRDKFDDLCKELNFNPVQTELLFDSLTAFNKLTRSQAYINHHSIIEENKDNDASPKRYAIPTHSNQPISGHKRERESASDWDLSSSESFVPLMSSTKKRKKRKKIKTKKAKKKVKKMNINADVSEEDKKEINEIMNDLGIKEEMNIAVRIYGYANHLAIYQDLLNLVKNFDAKGQRDYLKQQSSMRLRDIKAKIRSTGSYSSKQDMMSGICDKLKEYNAFYKK